MTERWERHVACSDGIGRDRSATLSISDKDRVVMVPPPGEGVVFTLEQLAALRLAIDSAVVELQRRAAVS